MDRTNLKNMPSIITRSERIIILLIFTPLSLFAQFELGIIAGPNVNSVNVSAAAPFSGHAAIDYFIGVSPGYRFNEKFKVLSDIKMVRKGFKTRNRLRSSDELHHRTTYLEFSEQLEYRPSRYFGFSAGGFVSVRLKQEIKFDSEWSDNSIELFPASNYGLTFGLRSYIKNITIFLLYDQSFKSVSNIHFTNANGDITGSLELKNRTLELGVGYIWNP